MPALFTPDLFDFLDELELNNRRDWFKPNQHRYEASVREPARAFIRAMEDPLHAITPHFVADDGKVGGSLMRVYRDTRFSKDKTPYKTNVGIQFRHEVGKDVHAPGFYFHIEAESVFVGCGLWHPDSSSLGAIREKIDAEQDRWTTLTGEVRAKGYDPGGDSLKRAPRGYPKDHPLVDELKRKDHIAVRDLPADSVLSNDLVGDVAAHFAACADYVRFLCEAIDVPF